MIATSMVAAACSPHPAVISPPLGSPITVGTVLSLSGSQAASGQMAKEGYLFCQDWINAKGGVTLKGAGHRLTIDIADDQSRPSIAAAMKGVSAVSAPQSDAISMSCSPDCSGISQWEGDIVLRSGNLAVPE